jgi:hypothetical protein
MLKTFFVLVHLVLADRKPRARPGAQRIAVDGRRIWPSQISP